MAEEHPRDDGDVSETAIKVLNSGEVTAKEQSIKQQLGRPLPCFGCGIGWFLFVLGFAFPILWYIAAALFLAKYQLRDPREREGLAAASIVALIFSIVLLITLIAVFI